MIPYRRLIPLLTLLAIVIVGGTALFITSIINPTKSPMIGRNVTFFSLPAYPDATKTLTPNEWKNKIVIVNFFASWCEPCKVEHPALMKLAQSGKARIIGIAWKDKPENLDGWFSTGGNPYHTVGVDTAGRTTLLFGLTGVPETFIIGSNGAVAYNHRSALTDEIINREILPLIDALYHGNAK